MHDATSTTVSLHMSPVTALVGAVIPFQKESSKSAANHFLWKGIWRETGMRVECYWYDEYDTLHLPIPVLYEMIPTSYSEHHKDYEKLIITITFGNRNPGAADDVLFPARTSCPPVPCVNRGPRAAVVDARTEGTSTRTVRVPCRKMARLCLLTHDGCC